MKLPVAETGRPSSFTQEVADKICERLAKPESLRSICSDESMPSRTTVFRWLREHEAFRNQYAHAREDQADAYFDEIIELSDTCVIGEKTEKDADGKVVKVTTGDMIERSRLGIETRKWALGRMKPKKYGDRLQLANDPEDPIGQLTDEQLEAKLAALMGKANGDG